MAEDKTVRVFYPGPGRETYHPRLGLLVAGEAFPLPAAEADIYLQAGLLKKAPAAKKGGK